jgi:adenine-specific DNA-methyltransferase
MITENPDYLTRQLITYIGNKRSLLDFIGQALGRVKKRLGKDKLNILDAFSGSGVVSRYFKSHAALLISNDLEDYATASARCFLSNPSEVDCVAIEEAVAELNRRVVTQSFAEGFIETLYAPRDETRITPQDRVFYTRDNACRLDRYRQLIDTIPPDYRNLLLGPLLSAASVHANTAGVFKGFYKDRRTGIGQFGGTGRDAVSRITGEIRLQAPVLSRFDCDTLVFQRDANRLATTLRGIDLAYIDPPYNQHPYGSNYFMLNLLVRYERPDEISKVSGIPKDWRRSGYNVKGRSLSLLTELLQSLDARFLLISFNNEGFIGRDEMLAMLGEIGNVETLEAKHNAFRGSRNLAARPTHVVEQLFLVEKA